MHASTEPQTSVTVDDHELARSIIEVRAIALANWRSNTMHASTEPQTTEPNASLSVTVDDHEDLPFDTVRLP